MCQKRPVRWPVKRRENGLHGWRDPSCGKNLISNNNLIGDGSNSSGIFWQIFTESVQVNGLSPSRMMFQSRQPSCNTSLTAWAYCTSLPSKMDKYVTSADIQLKALFVELRGMATCHARCSVSMPILLWKMLQIRARHCSVHRLVQSPEQFLYEWEIKVIK